MLLSQNYFAVEQFKVSQHHHSVYSQRETEKNKQIQHFCMELQGLLYWSIEIIQFHSLFLEAACMAWFDQSQSTPLCCIEPFVPDLTPGEDLLWDPSGCLTTLHSLMLCSPTQHNLI